MKGKPHKSKFAAYSLLALAMASVIAGFIAYKTEYDRKPATEEKSMFNMPYLYKFYVSSNIDPETGIYYGKKDASIKLTAFLSFDSDASGKFIDEIFPKLNRDYIDKGILKFSARNYVTFEDIEEKSNNFRHSLLLTCAGKIKEENYYDVYLGIFSGKNDNELISEYKIPINKLNDCMSDENTFDSLYKDAIELERLGILGINQRFYIGITGRDNLVLDGIPPYEKFREVIRKHEMQIGN